MEFVIVARADEDIGLLFFSSKAGLAQCCVLTIPGKWKTGENVSDLMRLSIQVGMGTEG